MVPAKNTPDEVSGVTIGYVYDLEGHAIAEVSGSGGWSRGEVFAGGKHIATYANSTTYFSHADWLGTERVRSDMTGAGCESITSLPFGDGQSTSSSCGDPSTRHFTGKERDSESGLDNFGARFDSSSMGRFTIPDWAASATAVPYADFDNPQSLNLYSYVKNNPLNLTDPTGHYQLNASGCGDNTKCQKKWDKAANKFEKRREKDLKSKKADVRAAAANFGALGEANGVHVGRAGNAETQTHEGTHVGDDQKFLKSYNPLTGGYDQSLNITHGQTEFNAFRAGAFVNQEHGFGPNDTQKIWDFLRSSPAYRDILNVPIFDPSRFPPGHPPPALPLPGLPD